MSFVMVGAANSDSARISFFGSTKGELAQKLDRGQDAARLGGLFKCPPNRAKWSPITRLTNSAWRGDTYLLFVGGTYGACGAPAAWTSYAFPTEFNGTQLSSAEPKGKNCRKRRVEYSQKRGFRRPRGRPTKCTESFFQNTLPYPFVFNV